jgi:hypothetical protein
MRDAPVVMLIAATAVCACAHLDLRVYDRLLVASRTSVLPIETIAFELDTSDNRVEKPEWAADMNTVMTQEIGRLIAGSGISLVDTPSMDACGAPCEQFRSWSLNAAAEIALQKTGRSDFNRRSVADWRYESDLTPVREALGADFTVTFFVRDTRETTGRAIVAGLGGMYTYWKQVAVACVNDLATGRMVWCELKIDGMGQLDDPHYLRRAVGAVVWPIISQLRNSGRTPTPAKPPGNPAAIVRPRPAP